MQEDKKPLIDQHDGEYMLEPVPMDKRRSTFAQVMVWVGFGYVVTGLVVGGVLAGEKGGLPPGQAFLAGIIGMGALFLITSFLGIAAQRTGFNLAILSRFSFGEKGKVVPMAVMALLTLGWFASITGMVGDIWGAFVGNPSGVIVFNPAAFGYPNVAPVTLEVFLGCVVWGAIFTITAYIGMGAIEKVAKIIAPLSMVAAFVVGGIYLAQAGGAGALIQKASGAGGLGIGTGITVVVGSWIAGAIMGVDLFRFNKNVTAVFLGAGACFLLVNPVLHFVGYIGVIHINEFNYVKWMLDVSFFVAIIGVIIWTTSLWTTNDAELYCNALYTGPALNAFGIKANRKKLAIICGIVGTILGSIGFYQIFFANFINTLGAMAPPLAAPILADYFIVRREKYSGKLINKQPVVRYAGLISFGIGAVMGYLFAYHISLPGDLPSGIVAMAISFVIYLAIYKFTPDKAADDLLVKQI
jgi:cytosine permease